MNNSSFDKYYTEIFQDDWPLLKGSLLEEPCYYELKENLQRSYFLDEASYFVAKALSVNVSDKVLDMCAAPGGKSLVILSDQGLNIDFTANEKSPERRNRLKKVLQDHLDRTIFERIKITGFDASRWSLYEKNTYDKILLDAPCSSERHVIQSEYHLKQWTPSRVKNLAFQQFSLLASAFDALKPGGLLIYSTCALTCRENDEVVKKLLKKRKNVSCVESPADLHLAWGKATETGWQFLPHRDQGRGPMFFAMIGKLKVEDFLE